MIDIKTWMDAFLKALSEYFGDRQSCDPSDSHGEYTPWLYGA